MKGRAPTSDEKKWMDFICEYGCIVCRNEYGVFSPASPHHMDGKTKPDAHFLTIPLCFNHHQSGRNDEECVARHPYKKAFEIKYGSERTLLKQMQDYVSEAAK